MGLVSALPKGVLPRPQLVITKNVVAEALEHLQALRKLYAQMRANELARIGKDVIVVRLKACSQPGMRIVRDQRFDDY